MIFSYLTLLLVFLYVIFLFYCNYHWLKIKNRSTTELAKGNIKVGVVVAVRDEIINIPGLMNALLSQDYSEENLQIIIVDDHSTDGTLELAEEIFKRNNFKNGLCLKSPEPTKKKAIQFAISQTNAELIITTDADVIMGRQWISSIVNEFVISNSFIISGPITLEGKKNFMERLQAVEFSGLNGIGAAGISAGKPMMCNGANLSFSKKVFEEVNGYDNSKSFSGDDTQLMIKIHQLYPGKISYLKDSRAIVKTKVITQSGELWQQRKRWASKIPRTLTPFTITISVLAWLVHASLLMQLIMVCIYSNILILILPWSMKIISEIVFLRSVERFFSRQTPAWIIITAQPLYCLYIVIVGLLAPLSSYNWKGRRLQ